MPDADEADLLPELQAPQASVPALLERAAATAASSLSEATLRLYETGWRQWQQWAGRAGRAVFPAEPVGVAMWAQHLHENGVCADTVAARLAALSHIHRVSTDGDGRRPDNPVDDPRVARVLRGLRRGEASERRRRQAKPLTDADVARIAQTSPKPRPARGGRPETEDAAARRALLEVALVRLLRDGMLRIGEAAAARWADLELFDDGSATLTVRRSKTDQTGEGAEVWLSPPTVDALLALKASQGSAARSDGARIVGGISQRTVARKLDAAFRHAGLGSGYSGHSGRVGMAQDLAASGAGLPAIMTAGRWKTADMPARYTSRQAARSGAVADWYTRQAAGQ